MFKDRFNHYLENNQGENLEDRLRNNYNRSHDLLLEYLESYEIDLEKVIFLLDELIEDKEYFDAYLAVKLHEGIRSRE